MNLKETKRMLGEDRHGRTVCLVEVSKVRYSVYYSKVMPVTQWEVRVDGFESVTYTSLIMARAGFDYLTGYKEVTDPFYTSARG